MNFFAHAFLAQEHDAGPAFVLGAMLPDLCSMGRVRLGDAPCGALGDGVRFHHASDAAFHAQRVFTERCGVLSSALEARGVRRGPARGVAHVAQELLLDGWLAREGGVPSSYRESLCEARVLLRDGALDPTLTADVARVCARVHASPLPEAYADVGFVCERVERALAPRPLLALEASERPAVAAALGEAAVQCASWAPHALAGVRRALNPSVLTHSAEETP